MARLTPALAVVVAGVLLAGSSMLTACSAGPGDAHNASATATPKSSPTPKPLTNADFPVANAGGSTDVAAQHEARAWLAAAVVPPGAVSSPTQPDGVAGNVTMGMWCKPMAQATGYWTVPSMSADDTMAWLGSHASRGMMVTGGSGNASFNNAKNVGGQVVDQKEHMSLEAMIFTVTAIGAGSGIRADAFAMASDSVCATPDPGTSLGIGG